MELKNSPAGYGAVTKAFHWLTALLVIVLLGVGLYMGELPLGAAKLQIYGLHKSFGITVLALTALRLGWHLLSHTPLPLEMLKRGERFLSRAVVVLFYLLLLGMPLSGWLMSSAAGRPVSVFGLFTLPDLIAPDKDLASGLRETHENMGTALMLLVGLHLLAALKHHFIDKDATLRRMLPW